MCARRCWGSLVGLGAAARSPIRVSLRLASDRRTGSEQLRGAVHRFIYQHSYWFAWLASRLCWPEYLIARLAFYWPLCNYFASWNQQRTQAGDSFSVSFVLMLRARSYIACQKHGRKRRDYTKRLGWLRGRLFVNPNCVCSFCCNFTISNKKNQCLDLERWAPFSFCK